jgi:N utilization substance protein B
VARKTAPAKKNTYRKKTRELLMRLVFQMTSTGDWSNPAKDDFLKDTSTYLGNPAADEPLECIFDETAGESPDMAYFNWAFVCLTEHLAEIDHILESASEKWHLHRMNAVDLAILRLAAAEIRYMEGIDHSISVNEAVVMARKYGSEKSPVFINGVLGKIVRTQEEV